MSENNLSHFLREKGFSFTGERSDKPIIFRSLRTLGHDFYYRMRSGGYDIVFDSNDSPKVYCLMREEVDGFLLTTTPFCRINPKFEGEKAISYIENPRKFFDQNYR